jgi:hypothetical protein
MNDWDPFDPLYIEIIIIIIIIITIFCREVQVIVRPPSSWPPRFVNTSSTPNDHITASQQQQTANSKQHNHYEKVGATCFSCLTQNTDYQGF